MANMRIVAYSDESFSKRVSGGEYKVMLNPEKLQWGRSVVYNEETSLAGTPSGKYNKTNTEKLSFELVIDCTGIVDSQRVDLPTEINNLCKVVYDYNGDIHRPNFVIVNWGSGLAFKCILTELDTSYTFFKPDGTPLRAKVSLSFNSYLSLSEIARKENKKSPDMTHLVTLTDGDSLPQISELIYRTPDYYIQLAQFNRLNKFRKLKSGTQLTVPPLIPQKGDAYGE